MVRVLQTNLNHSDGRSTYLSTCLAELSVGLAVAAEPYRVADRPIVSGIHWAPWR